jgi:hypothetical protein
LISDQETLLLLRADQQYPCSWDKILKCVRDNRHTVPDDAKQLDETATIKQLKSRLSVKLGKLLGMTRLSVKLGKLLGMTRLSVKLRKLLGMTRLSVKLRKLLGMTRLSVKLRKLLGMTKSPTLWWSTYVIV